MYRMALNFPNLAKGAEVQIDGLGIFENGYEYDITAEEADNYRVHNQVLDTQVDSKDGSETTTTNQGPTLLQAFKGNKSVSIRKMTDDELKALEPEPEPEVNVNPKDGNDNNVEGVVS